MNYSALIQNRKSVREFTDQQVRVPLLKEIEEYYVNNARRLLPELPTDALLLGTDTRAFLEGAAGYNEFLVGAPQYLVLLTAPHTLAYLNAGYIMEDLVLKLQDMGLDSCYVTFADGEHVKKALGIASAMEVAAILAFGYGKKTVKRMRLNIRTMSDVDIKAKYRYMEPKRSIRELTYVDFWGNSDNLERYIGFYEDMLWESLHAASLAPSYLNRQAYGFLLHNGCISLISRPDSYNIPIDGDLSLGIALLHFTAVAEQWAGKLNWRFGGPAEGLRLPEGHKLIATTSL